VLGSGGLEPHIGCVGYGTTATINTTHRRYIEIIPLIPPYPAAVPEAYNLELQIFRGYWMVSWFKNEFGLNEQRLAEKHGVPPEDLFDVLVTQVPPGDQMGWCSSPTGRPVCATPGLKRAARSSGSMICIPARTCTVPS
jgi:sugar (pentulose or hexulose) kinase